MAERRLNSKLVLLGESAVGKSSIVLRFVKSQFSEYQEATIGAAFLTQTVMCGDPQRAVRFEIWDTAGNAFLFVFPTLTGHMVVGLGSSDFFRYSCIHRLEMNVSTTTLYEVIFNAQMVHFVPSFLCLFRSCDDVFFPKLQRPVI
ncbi:hypothetical protein PHET_12374 [Paragonimus heterotremus]|uniref:Uncharacterized protein n=1 Tax=Paragonimus heterotremus TaxID=100268 RepID=A0A8J4WLX5_9TREM|nr:hypothetical protein PHET_12374 [Paragonimus heterotremus]